jgi:hypothetical protein
VCRYIFTFDKAAEDVCSNIIGTMTTSIEVIYSQTVQMFGIRFKPAGVTAFTYVPIEEFTNRNVELTLVETLFDKSFHETLPERKSVEEIITHINSYLIRQLPYIYSSDKQIIRSVDLIYLAKGQLSSVEAAAEACLCLRHFERKFKYLRGIFNFPKRNKK